MKKLLCLLVAIFGIQSLFAQTYDLNSFKYRHQEFASLSSGTDLFGIGVSETSFSNDNTYALNLAHERYNSFGYDLGLSHVKSFNSDEIQESKQWNISHGFSGNSDKQNEGVINEYQSLIRESELSTLQMNLGLFYAQNKRFYSGPRFKGFAWNISNQGNLHQSKQEAKITTTDFLNVEESSSRQELAFIFNFSRVAASVSMGRGRVNRVTDAVSALFILEDLAAKTGIQFSPEQIEKLGQSITQIRTTRYLDFRYRHIGQLKQLDKTLQDLGLKEEADMTYFTTLSDNWLYAQNMSRNTGSRLSFYISPSTDLSFNAGSSESATNASPSITSRAKARIVGGSQDMGVSYDNFFQINSHRERSYGGNLSVGPRFNFFQAASSSGPAPGNPLGQFPSGTLDYNILTNASLYYQQIYQPNSRTYISARFNPRYRLSQSALSVRGSGIKNFDLSLPLDVSFFRFVNRNLNYFVSARLNSNFSNQEFPAYEYNQGSLNYEVGAGARYIFY